MHSWVNWRITTQPSEKVSHVDHRQCLRPRLPFCLLLASSDHHCLFLLCACRSGAQMRCYLFIICYPLILSSSLSNSLPSSPALFPHSPTPTSLSAPPSTLSSPHYSHSYHCPLSSPSLVFILHTHAVVSAHSILPYVVLHSPSLHYCSTTIQQQQLVLRVSCWQRLRRC